MADPALVQKMLLDMTLAGGLSLYAEARLRGECFRDELDLSLNNCLTAALSSGVLVYLLAPARVGAVARAPWQDMISRLPNNVFEAASQTRTFTPTARVASLVMKAAQLSAVGGVMGAASSATGQAMVARRRVKDPSY